MLRLLETPVSANRILRAIVLPLIVITLLRWSGFDGLTRLILGMALFAWIAYWGGSDEGLSTGPVLGLHETRTPTDEDPRRYTPL